MNDEKSPYLLLCHQNACFSHHFLFHYSEVTKWHTTPYVRKRIKYKKKKKNHRKIMYEKWSKERLRKWIQKVFLLKRWRCFFLSSHPAALGRVNCRSSAVGGARCRLVGGKPFHCYHGWLEAHPKLCYSCIPAYRVALHALSIFRKKTEGSEYFWRNKSFWIVRFNHKWPPPDTLDFILAVPRYIYFLF